MCWEQVTAQWKLDHVTHKPHTGLATAVCGLAIAVYTGQS